VEFGSGKYGFYLVKYVLGQGNSWNWINLGDGEDGLSTFMESGLQS